MRFHLALVVLIVWGICGSASFGQRRPSPPPPPPPPPIPKAAANAATPATSGKKPVPGQPTPPPPPPPAEAANIRKLVAIEDRDAHIVFAPLPSTLAAVGKQVFDLATGQPTGKLDAFNASPNTKYALSPSGKHFAQTKMRGYVTTIEVIDTATGQVVRTLEYTDKDFQEVLLFEFTKFGHLAAGVKGDSGPELWLWRMEDGKLLKKVALKERPDPRKTALSDTGQYLAETSSNSLHVIDLAKGGKTIAEMKMPSTDDGLVSFIFVAALAFSPRTGELAGLMTGKDGEYHLVVWSPEGKVLAQHNLGLSIKAGYILPGPIQWAPDDQGWLLHGNYFFDRTLGAVAWLHEPPVQHNYPHRFLDNEHLVSSRGDFTNRELVSIEIPREKIAAAAASLRSGTPARLQPGDTISVQVSVGACRFSDPAAVKAEIEKSLAQRLKAGGLVIQPQGKIVLAVKYSEGAGEELRVVEGGILGKPTGQTVQETVTQLDAVMTPASGGQPIWQTSLRKGNPRIVHSDRVDDASVRDATFKMVSFLLRSMQVPYFVPADPDAIGLPLSVDLSGLK